MSLGKLLNTGKSLVGLHNSSGRYHLQKGALPKFESSKNPFATKPQAVIEREPQLPKLTPAEIAAANLKKTQVLPVLEEVKVVAKLELQPEKLVEPMKQVEPVEAMKQEEPVKAKSAEPVKVAAAVDGWLKKMNPMVWLANRKPSEPKPAIPRFNKGRAPVQIQGELSLDNIKVMRNDLSETDMEVVPAKPRPVAQAPAGNVAAMPAPELPSAKRALDYLNDRLLGKH